MRRTFLASALVFAAATPAAAATYQVGPTRTHTTLNALFAAVDLGGGDVVEVDWTATPYAGDVILRDSDAGAPGNPVILRGIKNGSGQRPHISGGANTVELRLANHVVFESFELTGGTSRCFYHHSHDVVIRDAVIHDCPAQGVLGADQDSGSLTIEYSEIYNIGGRSLDHAIYIATDQVRHPGSVFRLQYSYVHDSDFPGNGAGIGGNLIKSRAERNEIYYNWLESAYFHELELIGPDPAGVAAGWTDALAREDSDVVGNVIVHTASFGSIVRFGGDATSGGRGESFGRYRFVNNTVVRANDDNAGFTMFRLFEGIESLEFHNNVIWRTGSGAFTLVRAVEAQWSTGAARVTGSNNWIRSGFAFNPSNLPHTIVGTASGTTPGFVDAAALDFRPAAGSPLLDAGNTVTVTPPDYDLSSPLFPPAKSPVRALLAVGSAPDRVADGTIDVGAFERVDPGFVFANGFED
jgi:hypothetical protein